jgi:hypothetical protein
LTVSPCFFAINTLQLKLSRNTFIQEGKLHLNLGETEARFNEGEDHRPKVTAGGEASNSSST